MLYMLNSLNSIYKFFNQMEQSQYMEKYLEVVVERKLICIIYIKWSNKKVRLLTDLYELYIKSYHTNRIKANGKPILLKNNPNKQVTQNLISGNQKRQLGRILKTCSRKLDRQERTEIEKNSEVKLQQERQYEDVSLFLFKYSDNGFFFQEESQAFES